MIEVLKNPSKTEWGEICTRPKLDFTSLNKLISDVYAAVESNGDKALFKFTKDFDGIELENLKATEEEIDASEKKVDKALKEAIQLAKRNIEKFHQSQWRDPEIVQTMPGVECWQKYVGIDKVGIYIPGGSAPLFSTILMLVIPAKIAGCKEIVLCTPPNKQGNINPVMLYACKLLKINTVFKIGGAQAVAAMALGTATVPKVYKIFGPGNQYVTAAKQYAQLKNTAIDMPAGPSELLVLCDGKSNPAFMAADLLSQAEHGADSQVICLATDVDVLSQINIELESQLNRLPRKEIAAKAVQNSRFVLLDDKVKAAEFINEYAPEHLIIDTQNNDFYLKEVRNAGSVFIGAYTPESAGDYASGTNHTLPTNGFANMYSGVNIDSFVKKITYQKITAEGLKNIGPSIEIMAEAEQLEAHKNAVTIRLNSLS